MTPENISFIFFIIGLIAGAGTTLLVILLFCKFTKKEIEIKDEILKEDDYDN